MTASTRLERNLPGILDDLSAGPSPEYLDDVFVRTARMSQRPGWTFPERWLPMADIARTRAYVPVPPWRLVAVALLLIALVVAALFVAGSQRRVAPPFGPARNGLIPYENGGDIFVGDPVAGTSRLVLGGPTFDGDPGFSPDGTLLAFSREAGNESIHLLTMRSDGTDVRQISATPFRNLRWAQWAPDSRHLMVIDAGDGSNVLVSIDVTGREAPRRLAEGYQPDSVAYRPPNAKEILFRDISDGKFGLYVMAADGSNIRALVPPADLGDLHLGSIAYSPDGTQIYFQKAFTAEEAAKTPFPDDTCCKVWVMNADGTGAREFTSAATQNWSGVAQPSPDGRWVAFFHSGHIGVKRADGTGPITDVGPTMNGNPGFTWSPDSSKILTVPLVDSGDEPSYLLDPAGGPWKTIPWRVPPDPDWQRLAP